MMRYRLSIFCIYMAQDDSVVVMSVEEYEKMKRELEDIERAMRGLEDEVVAKLEEQKIASLENDMKKSE